MMRHFALLAALCSTVCLAEDPHPHPEQGQDDCDAQSVCKVGCGDCEKVYLHSAEFRLDRTDLLIPCRGLIAMFFSRTYRSQLPEKTEKATNDLGEGWVHCFEERLQPESGGVRRFGPTGRDNFWALEGSAYIAPPGQFGTLVGDDSTGWTLRFGNGQKHHYAADGYLSSIEDRWGNALVIDRDVDHHVETVTDPYGREYSFRIDRANAAGDMRLVAITDFETRAILFSYDEDGMLTGVTSPAVTGTSNGNNFPDGCTEEYAYASSESDQALRTNLTHVYAPQEVEDAGDAYLTIAYGTSGASYDKVTSFTRGGTNDSGVAAGGTTTLEYFLLNQSEPAGQPSLPRMRVEITARNQNERHYFGNEYGQHIMTRELTRGFRAGEPSYYETVSSFRLDGLLVERTFPLGNKLKIVHDTLGVRAAQANVLELRRVADATRGGGEDIVTKYSYEPLYQQLATIIDPRGNASNFTPPLGTASAARYTTTFYYDYQEGNGTVQEAVDWGITLGSRNLGDLNGDGVTNQVDGNRVRREDPDVTLRSGSEMAGVLGSTSQTILTEWRWDGDHLQKTIDREGNVTELEYYPEKDPDGDGTAVPGQTSTDPEGYLKNVIADAETNARRTSSETPLELYTSYAYNPLGDVTSIKNPRGIVSDFEVTDQHKVVKATRGADVSAATTSGELVTGESAFSYDTRFEYDCNGRLVRVEVEQSHDTVGVGTWVSKDMEYDILGQLVTLTEEVDSATSVVTLYRYDPEEMLQLTISPETHSVFTYFDERNLPWKIVRGYGDPDSSQVEIGYDDNGNADSFLDAEDNDGDTYPEETEVFFDGFDRPIKVADALGNELLQFYDIVGHQVRVELQGHKANDPGGTLTLLKKTYFRFDELSRVYQTDDSLFLATGFSPDRTVDLRDGNADDLVTSFVEYDALSRVRFTVEDDGEVRELTYDGASRVIEVADALGNTVERVYDSNANLIQLTETEVSPESHVSDQEFHTWFSYDQLDRLVRVVDNIGQTRRLGYDARDNLVSTEDAIGDLDADPWSVVTMDINLKGNTTTYVYDGLNRRILEYHDLRVDGDGENAIDTSNSFNADGRVRMAFDYDKDSRLIAFRDDNDNQTSYSWDALNRKVSQLNDDGESIDLSYDRDSNLTLQVDANGSIIARDYDALHRLIEVDITRATGVEGTTEETYGYDGLSRLTQSTDNNGSSSTVYTVDYLYDSLGRVLEEQQNGQPVSRVFEGDGRRASMRSPNNATIVYTHDAIDRVKTISDGGANPVIDCDYIGPGMRELRREYERGAYVKRYGSYNWFDDARRIERESTYKSNGNRHFRRYYDYNRENQRTSEQRIQDDELTDTYTYDSMQRLVTAEVDADGTWSAVERAIVQRDFALDGVGNRREVTPHNSGGPLGATSYSVNEMNEYTSIAGVSGTHSKNGNLTDDGTRLFVYDYKNRLVKVSDKSSSDPIADYFYDAANRRTRKVVYDGQSVDDEVLFIYDGWQVVEEQNDNEDPRAYFVWHGQAYIDELVKFQRTPDHPLGGTNTFFVHQNARKDVMGLTSWSEVKKDAVTYDAFGRVYDEDTKVAVDAMPEGCPYFFQGRRLDAETGLYYFRNRMYDPRTGRFLQRDPVWDHNNVGNQYAFVGNGPVSGWDPLGFRRTTLDANPRDFDDEVEKAKRPLEHWGCATLLLEEREFDYTWDYPGGQLDRQVWDTYNKTGFRGWLHQKLGQPFDEAASEIQSGEELQLGKEGDPASGQDVALRKARSITAQILRTTPRMFVAAIDKKIKHSSIWSFIDQPNWEPRSLDNATYTGGGCRDGAEHLQEKYGGTIMRFGAKPPCRYIGPYLERHFNWTEHYWVLTTDGRAYDAFTGSEGVPVGEYLSRFADLDPEYIDWSQIGLR